MFQTTNQIDCEQDIIPSLPYLTMQKSALGCPDGTWNSANVTLPAKAVKLPMALMGNSWPLSRMGLIWFDSVDIC
jgi:hypothetical protein